MTYSDLLQFLNTLSAEQLEMTVTVHDVNDDSVFSLDAFDVSGNEEEGLCIPDIDIGAPYLVRAMG